MNALNELVTMNINQPTKVSIVDLNDFPTKKDIESLSKRLDKMEERVLFKKDLGEYLRFNKPLKWKYKWNGTKKYARLGKERLEYWCQSWREWRPFYAWEGAPTEMRSPCN